MMSPAIMNLPSEDWLKKVVVDKKNFFDKHGLCAYMIDKLHT